MYWTKNGGCNMKKLLALILTICLLAVSGTVAFAEKTTDLSAYNDSELLTLLAKVQSEIVARRIEKTANLIAGTYIGGRDIPAGTYILAAAGNEDEYGIVSLRSVNDPKSKKVPSKLYESKVGNEAYSVFITIEEGDTLILPFPFTLTISGGVFFK